MDVPELRTITAEIDGDRAPQDVPIDDVVGAMSTGDADRARAAAGVLSEVAARRSSMLTDYAGSIVAAAGSEDPLVRAPAMTALAAIAESRPAVVGSHDDVVAGGLAASDPEVRVAASRAVAALAQSDAESVVAPEAAWSGTLRTTVNDPDRRVRADGLRALAEAAEADPRWATEVLGQAVESLHAGDFDVRHAALHLFTVLSGEQPASVRPHLEPVGDLLTDPYGPLRGLAAAVIGNVGYEEAAVVTPYTSALTVLLADPDPTAQQNASNALLALAPKDPATVAAAGAGDHVRRLLNRDVVAVQEIALHLTAVLVDHDPQCIADPAAVKDAVARLRSDPVLDVESRVFDRIEGALDRVAGTGTDTASSAASGFGNDAAETDPSTVASSQSGGQQGTDDEGDTEVFGSSSPTSPADPDTDTGSSSGAGDGVDVSFCPECRKDLSDYDAPTFCPECGWSLGE